MRRAFVLDAAIVDGSFTISSKADDAVEYVLNGHPIAGCTPPEGSPGACQQSCQVTLFPAEFLLRDGQVNTLEVHLLNLQSVPAGNGNFGYTAASYAVCVKPPS